MGTTTKIIDLVELRADDDFPAYAAVYSPGLENPQVLSPAAMRWSDDILLVRLETCRRFWLEQKKKLRCRLSELFDPLLQHYYGEDYLAVFADHPWQCLLYLRYQLRHQGRGLYLLQSRIDQNIFRKLDWDCWFSMLDALSHHWEAINARGFNPDAFRARQEQLRRFIDRIGVNYPMDMKKADANSMMRRFGKWVAWAWQWSFTQGASLENFPWFPLDVSPVPLVKRELEYPVNQWAYIEVLLREDLDRLSRSTRADEYQHVNRLDWEIILFNYQLIRVELSFRHPYSLHRDLPDFETALYQARYVYEDMMRKFAAREHDLDLPESMPFVGWTIELSETIQLAPQLWDLFAHELGEIDYRSILSLQNKLPLAFESYHVDTAFCPEQSFRCVRPGYSAADKFDTLQWSASATNKPLFFYPQAAPIDAPDRMQKIFLERSSEPWWLGQDLLQTIRDYFQLQDHNGRRSWVYRTQNGSWYKQGEYC